MTDSDWINEVNMIIIKVAGTKFSHPLHYYRKIRCRRQEVRQVISTRLGKNTNKWKLKYTERSNNAATHNLLNVVVRKGNRRRTKYHVKNTKGIFESNVSKQGKENLYTRLRVSVTKVLKYCWRKVKHIAEELSLVQ